MNDKTEYVIREDIKYGPLEKVDVEAIEQACEHEWFNQSLCRVNDCVARLGILKGEFHWHKHDREDEFFYVLKGRLYIDLEGRTIELGPNQGTVIPRGASHCPRAPERTVVLMIEGATVKPTGDD